MDEAGDNHQAEKPPNNKSDAMEKSTVEGDASGSKSVSPTEPAETEESAEPELGLPPPTWTNGKEHKKHCIRGGKLVQCGERCPEKAQRKSKKKKKPAVQANSDVDPAVPIPMDANGNPVNPTEQGATAKEPDTETVSAKKNVSSKKSMLINKKIQNIGATLTPEPNEYLTDLNRKRRSLYQAVLDYPTKPENLRHVLETGVSANMEFTEAELGMSQSLYVGYSPIHVACTEGNIAMLEDVIRYGADVDKIGRNGESALYYACLGCKITAVRGLLRHNADVNITHTNLGGETLLLATVACYDAKSDHASDYLEIARLLILAGADVNQSDYMDVSPLYVAVTKADTRMTRLLIDSGAMLLVSDNYEYATKLLMRAIDNDSEENVRLLIAYGCDVNGVSQSHGLRHTPLDLAVVKNNLGIILDLLTAGAGEDLNEPLHSAARNKHLVTLLLLIAKGGDVNARNNVDKATLMLTLTRARSETGVDMLMRLGADPDYENTLGSTPLWAAVRANYPELVKKFINCNCKLDTSSIQHFLYRPITALQLTFEVKLFEMSRWLLSAGAMMNSRWLKDDQLAIGLRDEPEMTAWLRHWVTTPRSLRFHCRKVIRQTVGLQLPALLRTILYPDSLKDYIKLKDIDVDLEAIECQL